MGWKRLVGDLIETGPDNAKKLLDIADRLPSESTLLKLIGTVDNLVPLVLRLEKFFDDGNLKRLENSLGSIPDASTLNRLINALPMLEKMPDQATLNRLIDKADSLQDFLKSLEEG